MDDDGMGSVQTVTGLVLAGIGRESNVFLLYQTLFGS